MSIEAAVNSWLTANAGVSALVGTRIFPLKIPQGAAFPAITYYRTGQQTVKSFGGLSGTSQARISIDCWGTTYNSAKTVALAVRGTKSNPQLDGYRGTVGGVKILAAFCTNELDLQEKPVHGDEIGVPHIVQDYDIWFEDV